jgi:hypothetical protein
VPGEDPVDGTGLDVGKQLLEARAALARPRRDVVVGIDPRLGPAEFARSLAARLYLPLDTESLARAVK